MGAELVRLFSQRKANPGATPCRCPLRPMLAPLPSFNLFPTPYPGVLCCNKHRETSPPPGGAHCRDRGERGECGGGGWGVPSRHSLLWSPSRMHRDGMNLLTARSSPRCCRQSSSCPQGNDGWWLGFSELSPPGCLVTPLEPGPHPVVHPTLGPLLRRVP